MRPAPAAPRPARAMRMSHLTTLPRPPLTSSPRALVGPSAAKYRGIYDIHGEKGLREGVSGSVVEPYRFTRTPEEVFKSFFGTNNPYAAFIGLADAFEKEGATKAPVVAKATVMVLKVSLVELYSGICKQLAHKKQVITASGEKKIVEKQLTVDLGHGKRPGHLFSFADEGHAFPGVKAGPAVYKLQVEHCAGFSIKSGSLVYNCKLPLLTAMTGTSVPVTVPDGRTLNIPLKEIVSSGARKVVPGEGLYADDGSRGDLVIEFDVLFPTTISPTQRTILKAAFFLPESMADEQRDAVKNFVTAFQDEKTGWSRAAAGAAK